jgi:stage II sporulation protein D
MSESRNFRIVVRLFASALIAVIVWGCAAVPRLKEGSEASIIRLPFVRVLIDNACPEIEITGVGQFAVECIRGERSFVYHSSQPATIRPIDGALEVYSKKTRVGGEFDEILISPRSKKGFLKYKNRRYRGIFRVLPHGRNLRLVNIVHIDDYLKGVVPPEMGKVGESEFEAIKAQATAARTYSLKRLGQYAGEPYDLSSDVADQLYHGTEAEDPLISKAIDMTRGLVMKYGDSLITAYYHSTCGGQTDDIEEVWDKPPAPYLKSVSDSGACGWSKYYRWKESYAPEQLKLRLEQYLSSEYGRQIRLKDIVDVRIEKRTTGGRTAKLTVKTTDKEYSFGRDRVRWVFKRSSNAELILASSRFEVQINRDEDGKIKSVDFVGGGYGHGVGMCQCGAMGMSRAGKKFDKILGLYYKDVRLVKLY